MRGITKDGQEKVRKFNGNKGFKIMGTQVAQADFGKNSWEFCAVGLWNRAYTLKQAYTHIMQRDYQNNGTFTQSALVVLWKRIYDSVGFNGSVDEPIRKNKYERGSPAWMREQTTEYLNWCGYTGAGALLRAIIDGQEKVRK